MYVDIISQIGWILFSFLSFGLPFGAKMLSTTSMLMTMIGAFTLSIGYLLLAKAFLFTVDELNESLVNIKEAIEDLEDQDGDKVKSLRRMFERTSPISGYGMFEVIGGLIFLDL